MGRRLGDLPHALAIRSRWVHDGKFTCGTDIRPWWPLLPASGLSF